MPEEARAEIIESFDGAQIRLIHYGAPGPRGTCVVVPGWTEPSEKYGEVALDLIDRGFSVVCYDPRGQGLSQRLTEEDGRGRIDDFSKHIKDLGAVVDHLNPERLVLLGHSMGGVVACATVQLASADAERLAGLVLVSSPGVRTHALLRGKPYGLISRLLKVPGLATLLKPWVRLGFQKMGFPRYPDGELIHTLHCVAHTSIPRHAERVHGLTLPTCVVWCEDDPLIERDKLQGLAEACPPGPRLGFASGGHNPQKSHALELAQALIAWRSELDA